MPFSMYGPEAENLIDGRSEDAFAKVLQGDIDPFCTTIEVDLSYVALAECETKLSALMSTYPASPLALVDGPMPELKLASMVLEAERQDGRVEPIFPYYVMFKSYGGRVFWWTNTRHGRSLIRVDVPEFDILKEKDGYSPIRHHVQATTLLLYGQTIPDTTHLGTPLTRWAKVYDDFAMEDPNDFRVQEFPRRVRLWREGTVNSRRKLPPTVGVQADDFRDAPTVDGPRDTETLKQLDRLQRSRYDGCRKATELLAEDAQIWLAKLFSEYGGLYFNERNRLRLCAWVSFAVGATVVVNVHNGQGSIDISGHVPGAIKADAVQFRFKVPSTGRPMLSFETLISALKEVPTE